MNKRKLLTLLATITLLFSCQKPPAELKNATKTPPSSINKTRQATVANLSVMAYNLENLFDHISNHGEKPVPLDLLEKKLAQVAQSILQIRGVGPDVLLVSEVENLHVLQMLNNKYLQAANYRTVVLLESNDERGIDVGLLSRFDLASQPVLHKMPFSDVNPTRGILEVTLELTNGKTLKAFANHFPSQSNPVQQRREAAEFLRELMRRAEADYVLAGGDFNVTKKEEAEQKIFAGIWQEFDVTHLLGCSDCLGTYSYKDRWDFLDAILVREKDVMVASKVFIPQQAPNQLKSDKTPQRFDKTTGLGVSDHLPIYVELKVE